MNDSICERFGMETECECTQVVYTRKEPLPLKKETDIRKIDSRDAETVCAHYTLCDREYMENRLKSGVMYGIYAEDRLAGFIGMHKEGSIGMLEVFEEYRGKGYGRALEAFYINLHLAKGYTPFGQVISGNDISFRLQEKLNLYPAQEKLYWLGKVLLAKHD